MWEQRFVPQEQTRRPSPFVTVKPSTAKAPLFCSTMDCSPFALNAHRHDNINMPIRFARRFQERGGVGIFQLDGNAFGICESDEIIDVVSVVFAVIVMSVMLKHFQFSNGFEGVETVSTRLMIGISFSIFFLWIELVGLFFLQLVILLFIKINILSLTSIFFIILDFVSPFNIR